MLLLKVTLLLKKPWKGNYEMTFVTIADTGEGAIEQVMDDLDLTGVEVLNTRVEEAKSPILIFIKEYK